MPAYCIDKYIGKKFNKITILSIVSGSSQRRKVVGECECGIIKIFWLTHLLGGKTKSCGCLLKTHPNKKTHGLTNHKLYSVWSDMKNRCYNKNFRQYKNYGGRGVRVCRKWKNNFMSFYNWAIQNGWRPGLQLDKDIIPLKLGTANNLYSPNTCCFVTQSENIKARK